MKKREPLKRHQSMRRRNDPHLRSSASWVNHHHSRLLEQVRSLIGTGLQRNWRLSNNFDVRSSENCRRLQVRLDQDHHPDQWSGCNGLPGQVVLVFQGGGALGSYQAGVYQALHEANIEPDWIIGTSIGAINASLIAGNRRGDRIPKLREFWKRVETNSTWGFSGVSPPAFPMLSRIGRSWSAVFLRSSNRKRSSHRFRPRRVLFDHAPGKDALRTRRFQADKSGGTEVHGWRRSCAHQRDALF